MKIAITISQLCIMLRICINTKEINKISMGELFCVIILIKSSNHEKLNYSILFSNFTDRHETLANTCIKFSSLE